MDELLILFSLIEFSDYVAFFALIISFFALGWNIVRDLIRDKTRLEIRGSVGGKIETIGRHGHGFFRDIDSEFVPPNPLVAYSITNTGRHPIVASMIEGRYKVPVNGKMRWVMNSIDLPKLLSPYENILTISDDPAFIEELKKGNIKSIFLIDTKRKKWRMRRREIRRLKSTASLLI
jgi:hypothetical protein